MFILNEDFDVLKSVSARINDKQLAQLIKKLESQKDNTNEYAKNKITQMRENGFPFYARPKNIQEKHYKRIFKEILYYIKHEEINVAMTILNRIIKENSYNITQMEYFMNTIPKEIIEIYNEYNVG